MKEILSGKKVFFLIMALIFMALLLAVFSKKDTRYIVTDDQKLDRETLELVRKIWSGEQKLDMNCPEYGLGPRAPRYAWECNPYVFQCLAQSSKSIIKNKKDKTSLKVLAGEGGNAFTTLARSQGDAMTRYGFLFKFKKNDQKFKMILEDSCSDTYLPQGSYLTGSLDALEQYHWDNIGKNYFIDKRPITRLDVFIWANKTKRKDIIKKFRDEKKWYSPAIGLSYKEQRLYCEFRGKRVMDSHLWDAASITPTNNKFLMANDKGLWPWSRRKKLSDLTSLYKKNREKLCQLIPSSECLSNTTKFFPDEDSITWMGMWVPMGGVMESMRVPWKELPSLKVSSFLFPLRSSLHKVGLKAEWSGLSSETREVAGKLNNGENLNLNIYANELPIGFRCFSERDKK